MTEPPASHPPAPRVVSRFRPAPPPDDPVYHPVPDDGLCLNVFLLLTDRPGSDRVLLGRLDPAVDWRHIGGMAESRIRETAPRWMLPSRQLFHFEGPHEAARSILKEQLELDPIPLDGPAVTSEAWQRERPAGRGLHWDLSFLFTGRWPEGRPLAAGPWKELRFLETATLDPATVGRGQADVLALAGHPIARRP